MLRRLLGNATLSLVGQLVTWTSTLMLTFAYGRYLGDAKFGELYFAITFVLLLGIPIGSGSGYNVQISRYIAKSPGEGARFLANVLAIKLVGWVLIYAVALLISWIFGFDNETRVLVAICGLTLLSTSISTSFSAVQFTYERALAPVVASILEKGVGAALGWIVLSQGGGVWGMAAVLFLGSVIGCIWQGIWLCRTIGFSFAINGALIRELLRTNMPFLLYGVIGTVYYRIDVVMLALLTNDQVVGWYGAGYRLFDTLCFLPGMMLTLLYPIFSKLALVSEGQMKVAGEKLMNFTLFAGMPIGTLLIVAADPIIRFLYHRPEFAHGIPSLQALAPGLVALYVNSALGIVFLNTKQDKRLPIQALIALVFNVSANLILIPLFAHVGAAIATTLSEVLLCGISIYLVPRHLRPVRSLIIGGRALAASIVMGVVVSYLAAPLGILVVPVAAVVYLVVAFWTGVVEFEDLQALRGAAQLRGALTRGRGAVAAFLYKKLGARVLQPVMPNAKWESLAEAHHGGESPATQPEASSLRV